MWASLFAARNDLGRWDRVSFIIGDLARANEALTPTEQVRSEQQAEPRGGSFTECEISSTKFKVVIDDSDKLKGTKPRNC